MKKKSMNFEAGLARMNEIAALLESGELDLQKSLELYKEGISLAASNRKLLEDAKHIVQMYSETGLVDFSENFQPSLDEADKESLSDDN